MLSTSSDALLRIHRALELSEIRVGIRNTKEDRLVLDCNRITLAAGQESLYFHVVKLFLLTHSGICKE